MRFVYKVGIVTCFLSFFLMSHNASAANLSYNMNDYDWITSVNLGTQYCAYSYNTFGSSPSICILTKNNPNMYGLRSYNIAHEKDDLAEFYIGVQSNINGADNYRNYGAFLQNFGAIDDNFTIIGVETVTDQNIAQNFFGFYGCSNPPSGSSYGLWMCDTDNSVRQTYYAYIVKVTILFTTRGSHPVGVKALNSNTPIMTCKLDPLAGSGAQCQVRLFGFTQWGYKGSSVNKEQSEATQNAADESESEAQDNSSNQQTTNLIGAFQSFVTALTSLNATNCNVTLPFPSNLGGSMQVNICQNKDYAGNIVSVFGSLTLIVFYIPFSLKLLSMIYNEIRSFTNG